MKSFLLLVTLFAGIFSTARAQAPFPDCASLLVDSIYVSDTNLRVVLSNTCDTCASGAQSAVYLEMIVVRRSNPQDTFARSACYCFTHPANNGQLLYILSPLATTLPPATDIRVGLYNLCDDIPFRSATTGIRPVASPATRIAYEALGRRVAVSGAVYGRFRVMDAAGRIVAEGRTTDAPFFIDASAWPPGIYAVELSSARGRAVEKLVVP